ncbi:MAG: class I SAM-dependent methyltransferase [Treponema sp.]|nr:class I SAM-dependent methyltransferase [Treponema sp.]
MDNTINYYNNNAKDFISQTKDVAFSEHQDLFIDEIKTRFPANSNLAILDFGCGSGRDTKYFIEHGFNVEAIDGSKEMCSFASKYTGINVKQVLFHDWKSDRHYHGIWACSSILHLQKDTLLCVFKNLLQHLEPNGVLYTSFKYGDFEGERNGRYFINFTEDSFNDFLSNIDDFKLVKSWVTSDVRPGRANEKWLNLILTK